MDVDACDGRTGTDVGVRCARDGMLPGAPGHLHLHLHSGRRSSTSLLCLQEERGLEMGRTYQALCYVGRGERVRVAIGWVFHFVRAVRAYVWLSGWLLCG